MGEEAGVCCVLFVCVVCCGSRDALSEADAHLRKAHAVDYTIDHRVSGIESHIWKCPWNLLVGLSLVDVFHRWRAVLSEARRFMDTGPVQKGRVALCKHYLAPLWEIHDSSVGG